jgi:hypothetical protein
MLRAFAVSRSIVFTPTPIFWISRSFGAAAIIATVAGFSTCHRTSVSGSKAASFASSASGHTVIVKSDNSARRAMSPGPAA